MRRLANFLRGKARQIITEYGAIIIFLAMLFYVVASFVSRTL
jgi:hypothetical protein